MQPQLKERAKEVVKEVVEIKDSDEEDNHKAEKDRIEDSMGQIGNTPPKVDFWASADHRLLERVMVRGPKPTVANEQHNGAPPPKKQEEQRQPQQHLQDSQYCMLDANPEQESRGNVWPRGISARMVQLPASIRIQVFYVIRARVWVPICKHGCCNDC